MFDKDTKHVPFPMTYAFEVASSNSLWGLSGELHPYVSAKSLQSCLTLCDPMDCSPPGSSVHGILQVGILEWVAILFSRGIFLTPGIERRSPLLQADSLTSGGKPDTRDTQVSAPTMELWAQNCPSQVLKRENVHWGEGPAGRSLWLHGPVFSQPWES